MLSPRTTARIGLISAGLLLTVSVGVLVACGNFAASPASAVPPQNQQSTVAPTAQNQTSHHTTVLANQSVSDR